MECTVLLCANGEAARPLTRPGCRGVEQGTSLSETVSKERLWRAIAPQCMCSESAQGTFLNGCRRMLLK